jgi:hypothetical protein
MTLYIVDINKATILQAQSAFAFVCVTSPTAGAIASGPISAWAGGYDNKGAIKLTLFLALFSCLVSIPMSWFDSFYAVVINLWIYLFTGGICVPLLTGIFLAHVEIEYRT